jgi:hypothetical protein
MIASSAIFPDLLLGSALQALRLVCSSASSNMHRMLPSPGSYLTSCQKNAWLSSLPLEKQCTCRVSTSLLHLGDSTRQAAADRWRRSGNAGRLRRASRPLTDTHPLSSDTAMQPAPAAQGDQPSHKVAIQVPPHNVLQRKNIKPATQLSAIDEVATKDSLHEE